MASTGVQSFTAADGTRLSTLGWTEDFGSFEVQSNAAQTLTADQQNEARYTAAQLDSADHSVQGTLGGRSTSNDGGLIARQASSTRTFYLFEYQESGAKTWKLRKRVSGSLTDLDSYIHSVGGALVGKLTVDGATQVCDVGASTSVMDAADSAISAGQYCGVVGYSNVGERIDDWSAEDLAAGGLDFTHTGNISGAYTDAAGRTIEKFFTGDVYGTAGISSGRTIEKYITGDISAEATWASVMSFESGLLDFIWTGGITGEAYVNAQRTIEKVITGALSGEFSAASQRSIEKMITGAVEGELTLAAQRTIEKVVSGDISGEYTVSHGRVVEKFFSGGIIGTLTAASGRTVEKFFTGNVAATGTWASTYSQTTGAWTLIVKPDTTWTLVAKPTGGAAPDGFIVDGATDGAYARPHTDGFFAPDGTWTPVVQRWTTWTLINKPS